MAPELPRVESADYRQVGPGDALANLTRLFPQPRCTARHARLPAGKHENARPRLAVLLPEARAAV